MGFKTAKAKAKPDSILGAHIFGKHKHRTLIASQRVPFACFS
jgi:hypothetical protein